MNHHLKWYHEYYEVGRDVFLKGINKNTISMAIVSVRSKPGKNI